MSSNNINGGAKANRNGRILESSIVPAIEANGYIYVDKSSKNFDELKQKLDRYYIRNAPYTTIYGGPGKTEFLLVNKPLGRTIRIECKRQESAGSVDEKYPYLYLNCAFSFNETDTVLIISGNGMKSGAMEWMKKQIKSRWLLEDNKNIHFFRSIDEFITWINNLE